MKSPKVRLYIRVRLPSGRSQYFDPVWTRNRTLRQGYALVDGGPEAHPGSTYYLRYLRNGKRVFESVGVDADRAVVALRNKQYDLQSISLGRSASATAQQVDDPPVDGDSPSAILPSVAAAEYLDEIRRFKVPKTFLICKVPDTLIAALAEWKKHSASILVFPGNGGKPNGHFFVLCKK